MTKFTLATLLLQFWERLDADKWIEQDTVRLVRCDIARREGGIPGVLE